MVDEIARHHGELRPQPRRGLETEVDVADGRPAEVGAVAVVVDAVAPVVAAVDREDARAHDPEEAEAGLPEVDGAVALEVAVDHAGEGHVVAEREARGPLELLVLQRAAVVVQPQVGHRRPPRHQGRLGPPPVPRGAAGLLEVDAGQEAGVGDEARIDAAVGDVVADVAPLLREVGLERPPGERPEGLVLGLGARREEADAVGPAQPEAPVDAGHPVVVGAELARGHDGPEIRLGVEVVAGASEDGLRGRAVLRVRGVVETARRLVVGHDETQRGLAHLAGQLAAEAGVDDGAGVDQGHGRRGLEDLLPLEEERALLGVEQGEPLVGLDLRPVRLDLREVGVVGDVGGQVRGEAVLHAEPQLAGGVVGRVLAAAGVERAEPEPGHLGQELEVAAQRHVGQALEGAELRELAGHAAGDGRPRLRL